MTPFEEHVRKYRPNSVTARLSLENERLRVERDWLLDWCVEAIKRSDPAFPVIDEYSPKPTRESVLTGLRTAIALGEKRHVL
jgi:hypothetical protein